MDMHDRDTKLAAVPDPSCCYSKAPLPDSQFKTTELSLPATPLAVADTMWHLPRMQEKRSADVVQDLSPPSLQSLLCSFLI